MEKREIKVLLLQSTIPNYREPVFDGLGKIYDLTVVYTDIRCTPRADNYKALQLNEKKWHSIRWVVGIPKLCNNFDVVIFMHDMHYFNYCLLPFLHHKYKTIAYGIGIRASYTRKFDLNRKKTLIDYLLKIIIFKADAILFYFKEVLKFWNVSDDKAMKCFETRNTVEVEPMPEIKNEKAVILFVGTLYKEKKVDALVNAYKQAYSMYMKEDFPMLEIIGSGNQMQELKEMVRRYELESKVIFTGPIYDEKILAQHFSKALICISPNQAGLSVPHSFGYGVPFVTTKDAITGGEILHIRNEVNGILLNSIEELPIVIQDVYKQKAKYIMMGKEALKYYNNSASIDMMIKGFDESIQYVLQRT